MHKDATLALSKKWKEQKFKTHTKYVARGENSW